MKKQLDWQTPEVVNIFDEVSLWSAPFGRLLLENIPMKPGARILDIGFGAGFPLIELSQRFGEKAKIYGIDLWEAAMERAKKKIETLGIENITIFEQSATKIPLPDNEIDLITSNLGINNFEEKELVIQEALRVLKPGGHICITSNPIGTFKELFKVFKEVMIDLELKDNLPLLKDHIAHRGTEASIIQLFERFGFRHTETKESSSSMRFVDAEAVLDHSLIRIGFLSSWKKLVPANYRAIFFTRLVSKIKSHINAHGEFRMSIPMLYIAFRKETKLKI